MNLEFWEIPNRRVMLQNPVKKTCQLNRSGDHFGNKGRLRVLDATMAAKSHKMFVPSIQLVTEVSSTKILELFSQQDPQREQGHCMSTPCSI